jgi:hypothetical protein
VPDLGRAGPDSASSLIQTWGSSTANPNPFLATAESGVPAVGDDAGFERILDPRVPIDTDLGTWARTRWKSCTPRHLPRLTRKKVLARSDESMPSRRESRATISWRGSLGKLHWRGSTGGEGTTSGVAGLAHRRLEAGGPGAHPSPDAQGSSLELAWCVAGCNCKFATTRTVRSVTSCGGRMVTCACAVRFELDMEVGPDVWSAYVHTVYIHVQIGKVPTQRTHRPTRAFPVHILRTCDASAPCPSSRRGAEHQSLRTSNVMFPSPARRRQGIYGHHDRALERIPTRLHAPSSPTVSFLN